MVCEYCGQVLMDGAECDCPGARLDRKIKKQIIKGKAAIQNLFGSACEKEGLTPVADENIEMMDAAVERIANCKMYSVTLVFPEGVKAKLTRSAKGAIKVERTEVKKNGLEVEE